MFKVVVYFILLFSFSLCTTSLFAQGVPDTIGDIDAPVDTSAMYKKLYNYSKDKKLAYFLFRAVFNPPSKKEKVKSKSAKIVKVPEKKYRGKIIRNIITLSLDPFGTNINDTSKQAHNFFQKGGNKIHVQSRRQTILNYLLFKVHDPIDPLELLESERLLRGTTFIRDARIIVQPVAGTRDSFDILIITQDYWSIRFSVDATESRVRYRLTEKNMMGWGHEFDNRLTDKLKTSSPLYLDGSYSIPNVRNTYISPEIYYGTSPDNNVQGIKINRPFYSPLTKMAGGIELLTRAETDSLRFRDDTVYNYTFNSFVFDTWVGYSIPLFHGETDEERTTRLIAAIRYSRIRYPKLTPDVEQVNNYFSQSDFYLGSLSLASRKYIRERYVLKFGEIEDVPEGNKITLTSGIENKQEGYKYYFGIDGAISRYFPSLGYVYLGSGYSSFVDGNKFVGSTVYTQVIYFSPLSQFGRWRVRQFATLNFIYGVNRKENEFLYLNNDNGLPGYKGDLPEGTSKLVLVYQSVLYTPYVFLGFRFAPIVIVGAGYVGGYNQSVFHSKLYQLYGVGLLVKNELLVLNTFQVTLAFYPILPAGGAGIKFNPVSLDEKRFKDFDITRPDVTPFE